jgi:hypothetical protein
LANRVNSPGSQLRSRAQINRFFAKDMQDQYYDYNYNKFKGSRARFATLNETLSRYGSARPMSLNDAIDLLSDHRDADVGGSPLRSFGRTVVKANTSSSTVALPGLNQIWFSSGGRFPIPHGHFIGFHVDFAAFDLRPVGEKRTHRYDNLPDWDLSLSLYTQALIADAHDSEAQSLRLIGVAIEEALKDKQDVTAYRFIQARLLHKIAAVGDSRLWTRAMTTWRILLKSPAETDQDGYDRSLIALYAVATSDAMKKAVKVSSPLVLTASERAQLLNIAEEDLKENYRKTTQFDLLWKLELVRDLRAGKSLSDLPPIDFMVVFN